MKFTLAPAVVISLLVLAEGAHAQTPPATEAAPPTVTATAPIATATAAVATATAAVATIPASATAVPITATTKISGALAQDTDGDGKASSADTAAVTLVELVSQTRGVFSVLSAGDGSFVFDEVPNGDYQLELWWSPGFVDTTASAENAGLATIDFVVNADGSTKNAPQKSFLLKVKPDGLIPYPVRSGPGGEPARGRLNVSTGARVAAAALPATGTAGGTNAPFVFTIVGAALLVVAAVCGVALSRRKRAPAA